MTKRPHILGLFLKKIIFGENGRALRTLDDFYSESMFRDLLFHEQEHTFNLMQIEKLLYLTGLDFCGFNLQPYRENLAMNEARLIDDFYDLKFWHRVEKKFPDLFIGMYQSYCQKI